MGCFAVDAGKSVIKWGLDIFNKQREKSKESNLNLVNLQRQSVLEAAMRGKSEEERIKIANDPKYKLYESYDEYQQNVPLIKFLNSDTGKEIVSTVSEKTSNLPLKVLSLRETKKTLIKDAVTGNLSLSDIANFRSIADQTYDKAYSAWLEERNNPDNPTWKKFLFELQDTGVQSGIGILLSIGTTYATRSPQAGIAVSSAYYASLSADEQLQERGEVDSLGNIAIDVVGDQVINKITGNLLKSGGSAIVEGIKGFGVEGGTEVAQSFAKYANDYANAGSEEEKNQVIAEASNYVKSGAIAMEFAVGGVVGGIASGISAKQGGGSVAPQITVASDVQNFSISEAIGTVVAFERSGNSQDAQELAEYTEASKNLNEYTTTFGNKQIYVPNTQADAPLVEVTTTELPTGDVVVKFSANTDKNGFSSTYDFNQRFGSQKEAVASAVDAIVSWAEVQSEQSTDVEDKAQLEKIIEYAKNPKSAVSAAPESIPDVETEQTSEVLQQAREIAQSSKDFVEMGERLESELGVDTANSQDIIEKLNLQGAIVEDSSFQGEISLEELYTQLNKPQETEQAKKQAPKETKTDQGTNAQDEQKTPDTANPDAPQEVSDAVDTKDKGKTEKITEPKEATKKPVKSTKKTNKRKSSSNKGKSTGRKLITQIGDSRIPQRTSKTIYKKNGAVLGKGEYDGRAYTTDQYILEFEDVKDVQPKTPKEKMPTDESIKGLIDRIGNQKVGDIQAISLVDGHTQVAELPIGDTKTYINLDYYNYFSKKYPNAEWRASDTSISPIALYENNEIVAMVMPMQLDTATLVELESFRGKPAGAPSGYAQAVFSDAEIGQGGQPEKKSAEIPIKQGQLDEINPIELPEMVQLARELMNGNVPQVTKLRSKSGQKLGDFLPAGDGRIRLNELLFKQENLPAAAKTLAHEIGHLVDYLPTGTMKRGNILGRIATLNGFLRTTFSFKAGGAISPSDRSRLQTEARKEIAKKTGKKQKDFNLSDKRKVRDLYNKKVDEAIKSGGFIENATIKKELLTLTRWWHPYDPKTVTDSYNKYRESSSELYAEAISVLFNAPRRLQDIAPTFYEAFFEGLDNKPDVRDAYFELQSLLAGDRSVLVKKRREGVQKMFKDGDHKSIDLHNQRVAERENRRKQYWSHFKHTIVDKNFQIIDRVRKAKKNGANINPDENPVYFLEERNYIGGKIKAIFEREFNSIYSTLNENEILWDDFGEVLFYERIAAGDRSDVANPRGITPSAANELLDTMKQEYGTERWDIMQEQVEKFRTANRKITEDAFEAGLYSKELYEQMQENPAYVTFQVLDHIDEGMTSRVYKSLGTLKDISNPADSTMLKVISTIRAAERNRVTKATVDFIREYNPEEITEAKYTAGKKGRFPIPSRKPDQELITFFDQGKMKGYYVDPYIAESINNQSVGQNAPIVPVIRFMNKGFFRPLFIGFNLGFQSFNLMRDFFRYWKNIPGMTIGKAIGRYAQAGRISKIRGFGLPKNPSQKDIEAFELLNKLEEEKVLSTTFNDLISGRSDVDKQVEKILADTGVKDFQPKPMLDRVPRFVKPAAQVLDKAGILKATSGMLGFIENLGNMIETLPKAAGVFELQNENGELTKDQKSFIRRKIGSPDFLAGGTYKPITNEVFLFSNAIIQGIRSDIEVVADPKTRSGWMWKTAKLNLIPKLLMLAAMYGLFGDEWKEMMEDASEYDRTNYTIIPLGRDENGKTIYFRLPSDETGRLIGGLFWKTLRIGQSEQSITSDLMDIVSLMGGQVPSISPAISVISATTQYAAGQNPYDAFRGRQVLSDTVFKAGGWDADKAFMGWVFQQLGGGVFYRFYHEPSAQREQSKAEKFFNAPVIGNILGRFIRVSNYGQTEKLKAIEARVEKEKARETLDERKLINKYIKEARDTNQTRTTAKLENELVRERYDGFPKTKDDMADAKRLVKKFRLSLERGNADPKVTALVDAGSNEAKLEILKEIRSDMDTKEFSKLSRQLVTNGIVSKNVINQLQFERDE